MNPIRILVFIAVVLGTLLLCSWYTYRHASRAFRLERRGQLVLGASLLMFIAAMFLGRSGLLHGDPRRWVESTGAIGALAVLITVPFLGLIDIGRWGSKLWSRFGRQPSPERRSADPLPETPNPVPGSDSGAETGALLSRRGLLLRSAQTSAFALGGGASLYGNLFGRHDYQID
ncbi:MAG: hypothetical protein KC416_11495, partial [Myxococcales bacterium]|nr:hypothetical protein [Myxococcales bacterium]